jgi:4-hydroxybenzoate polyprenyltransferase
VNEAKILTGTLYHLAIFLGAFHLPYHVLPFWVTSVVCTYFYTPVFKKITFIKNIACALVVALTIPFMGLSVTNSPVYNVMVEAPWMFLTSHTTFMSSLYVEILLDILDKHGDQEANIRTLPVIFGINITLVLLCIILGMENYSAILFGAMNRDPWMIIATSMIYLPFYKNIRLIGASSHTKIHRDKSVFVNTIRKSIKDTTIQMILYFFLVILRTATTTDNFTLL